MLFHDLPRQEGFSSEKPRHMKKPQKQLPADLFFSALERLDPKSSSHGGGVVINFLHEKARRAWLPPQMRQVEASERPGETLA